MLAVALAGLVMMTPQDAASVYRRSQEAVVTVRSGDSVGTGFVIGDGTLVATCWHVVESDPESILIGSKRLPGNVVARDPEVDVAIIKLKSAWPSTLQLATQLPSPGTKVFVIGNPLGVLDKSLTDGIVSAVRRDGGLTLLQISAAISEGSSGSPVILGNGTATGMVSSTLEGGQSLNFAVPAADIKRVVNMIGKPELPIKAFEPTISFPKPSQEIINAIREALKAPAFGKAPDLTRFGEEGLDGLYWFLETEPDKAETIKYLVPKFDESLAVPVELAALEGGNWAQRLVAGYSLSLRTEIPLFDNLKEANQELIDALNQPEILGIIRTACRRDLEEERWNSFRYQIQTLGNLQDAKAWSLMRVAAKSPKEYVALAGFWGLCRSINSVSGEKEVLSRFDRQVKINKYSLELWHALKNSREPYRSSIFRQLLKSDDQEVIDRAMGSIGAAHLNGLIGDVATFLGSTKDLRQRALVVLGQLKSERHLKQMLDALSNADPSERQSGVAALCFLNNDHFWPQLSAMKNDPDEEVRRTLALFLRHVTNRESVGVLKALMKDSSESVRESAQETYDEKSK